MKIDCYLSPECGSEVALQENIGRALAMEKVEAELNLHRIDDNKALALGVTGSPSVFCQRKGVATPGSSRVFLKAVQRRVWKAHQCPLGGNNSGGNMLLETGEC